MSNGTREAGRFDLIKFTITSYDGSKTFDIAPIIHSFEIHESMKKGSVRGFAKMFDSVGLLQDFPLLGEEFIEIEYLDFFEEPHIDKMFLYSITDVKRPVENNPSRWEYTMHFVSSPKIYTENIRIRRGFGGPVENRSQGGLISDFVQTVYDEFYIPDGRFHNGFPEGPKPIVIQPTDSFQRLVVPNYTPEQTMHFFARRAYNASSFSQTYHFFENRKAFAFATNEYLQNEADSTVFGGIYSYTQGYEQSFNPEDQAAIQQKIIGIDYGEVVNSIDDINGGGYVRSTYEIDLMSNIVNKIDYEYAGELVANNPGQTLYHTIPFLDERLTKEDHRWVIKDYTSQGVPGGPAVRPNTHYSDIYNKKGAHLYHTNRNRIICTVHGNNSVVAGSTISLELIKHTSDDSIPDDIERSGTFLVEAVENIFYERTYLQKLTLTRNGIGAADGASSSVPRLSASTSPPPPSSTAAPSAPAASVSSGPPTLTTGGGPQ